MGLDSIRECNYTMAGYVRPEDLTDSFAYEKAVQGVNKNGF